MISYEEALKKVLANIHTMEPEERPLLDSPGMVTTRDVRSGFDLPMAATSGPDGYAVRSADIKGAGSNRPVTLRIIETVKAGSLPKKTITPGTAARIMTGSVVPEGADCVVRFEDTDEPEGKNGPRDQSPSSAKIYVSVPAGGSIVKAGGISKKGTLMLPKGSVIGAAQISSLIACGIERVQVVRRPVIAVIATGDELIKPGRPIRRGKTYNCNASAIVSLITHFGGIPKVLGIARDRESSITAKIQKGLTADAVITSGGVSMGDYDLVRRTLGKMGKVIFARINMGPGAAVVFGTIAEASDAGSPLPVFALAGPPSGCLVNFETLVRPALLKMRGIKQTDHPTIEAIASDSYKGGAGMAFVKWTRLFEAGGEMRVELGLVEKMGGFAAMAAANSITIIPKGVTVEAGDKIRVLPLSWRDRDY